MDMIFIPFIFPIGGCTSVRRLWPYAERTRITRYDVYHFPQNALLVGELPGDFLRVDTTPATGTQSQISVDEQTAIALQQQLSGAAFTTAQAVGRLSISVIQAKLVKNYGVTRMDPYVRIRIGHNVYETHTDYNGAKNPHWNKLFHCFLSPGVTAFLVEIYDECAFTVNEKIAWAHVVIPEAVFSGQTVDIWHPLSGRQGESKEGNINLVLSYQAIPPGSLAAPPVVLVNTPYMMPGVVQYPAAAGYVYPPYTVPVARPGMVAAGPGFNPALQPAAQQQPAPVPITEDDVKQVQEMFPEMDAEVVKGVLESHRGNKDAAVNALLAMNDANA
ncbi:toll-interacting protein isoform X1 [Rhipicephalus sanguineus]|uniref:toll-interacting protein isoform X1 n=1 Tax=Rhipicephalus sanguineus TaxID=34632 RepID=UPI0018939B1F|nr:toll-interacting protein isoform X1 [Rhipicephalus sanguineus]